MEVAAVRPTVVADEQIGERLGIPRTYYRRMQEQASPLLAANVNHWLETDTRSFYCRTLLGADDQPGILRAVMSDRFRPIDDLDTLMAMLEGIKQSGTIDPGGLQISADRSMRRMHVRVNAPQVTLEAPELVARYRDPGSGGGGQRPDHGVVSAGLVARNSDVGQGAWTLVPRITFLACLNGMTRTQDSLRQVHVGGKQAEGIIDWSQETQKRTLAVIASQTADAVRTFLSPDYLAKVVDELRGFAQNPMKSPVDTVNEVTRQLRYTEDEQKSILDAFITGGDTTPLGLAQAFTYVAQGLGAERSAEFEDDAWQAMALAAR